MGPKFNNPLYFEEDGVLEVCGPANFGPNDVLLKVEKITIIDHEGHVVEQSFDPPILVGSGDPMWESEIEDGRDRLVPGPARGVAQGRVRTRDNGERGIGWADRFDLVNPGTFFEDTAGG
ncbi:MAG TPA: hypothetical protein VHI30_08090 [Gaiellales bacterium]|jgi:hypothetical protein|nr:hypothetical protein [Gaiellales bacterium]